MKKHFLILLFAGAAGAAASAASAADIVIGPLGDAAPLAGEWKRQLGDDARWADPAFDDSAWTTVVMPQPVAPGPVGFQWHRLSVVLPDEQPRHLLLAPLFPAYEIFVNGQRLGSFGEVGKRTGQLYAEPILFALPPARRLVIAIRSYDVQLLLGRQSASVFAGTSWIGAVSALEGKRAQWALARGERSGLMRVVSVVLIAGGLFFLAIPFWRRHAQEYIWGGAALVLFGVLRLWQNCPEALGWSNRFTTNLAASLVDCGTVVVWAVFCKTFFRSRLSPIAWVAFAVNMACGILNIQPIVDHLNAVGIAATYILWELTQAAVYFSCYAGRRHSSREAYWPLHAGVLLWTGANLVFEVSGLFSSEQMFTDTVTPFETVLRSSILLFALGLGISLNQRAGERDREQDRLQSEMAAAAEVQALMLPAGAAEGVEAIYLPAAEVGGDFYQVLDRDDGSRVILVGDVSGKGLRAAMLVSVAIGILRHERSSSPALILRALNDGLAGHTGGGFVTCCCARFGDNGSVMIANAGHPSPYCDGREVAVEAGLPLGVMAGVEYEESIAQGDRFTFVSDGVVEAENAERELFGFDRTCEISMKSAQEIAEAAKAWGQTDDITVVTVQRVKC